MDVSRATPHKTAVIVLFPQRRGVQRELIFYFLLLMLTLYAQSKFELIGVWFYMCLGLLFSFVVLFLLSFCSLVAPMRFDCIVVTKDHLERRTILTLKRLRWNEISSISSQIRHVDGSVYAEVAVQGHIETSEVRVLIPASFFCSDSNGLKRDADGGLKKDADEFCSWLKLIHENSAEFDLHQICRTAPPAITLKVWNSPVC